MLAADVDLCVVASPTGLHHEHAKAAMEAGAHVLVEKPFTVTAADALDLVDTAARTEAFALMSYPLDAAYRSGRSGQLERVERLH